MENYLDQWILLTQPLVLVLKLYSNNTNTNVYSH